MDFLKLHLPAYKTKFNRHFTVQLVSFGCCPVLKFYSKGVDCLLFQSAAVNGLCIPWLSLSIADWEENPVRYSRVGWVLAMPYFHALEVQAGVTDSSSLSTGISVYGNFETSLSFTCSQPLLVPVIIIQLLLISAEMEPAIQR